MEKKKKKEGPSYLDVLTEEIVEGGKHQEVRRQESKPVDKGE